MGLNAKLLMVEAEAIVAKEGTFGMTDQPTTCPGCGCRTDWEDLPDGMQLHECLGCGRKFVVEEDPEWFDHDENHHGAPVDGCTFCDARPQDPACLCDHGSDWHEWKGPCEEEDCGCEGYCPPAAVAGGGD